MALDDQTPTPFEPPDLQAFAKTIVNNLVSVENIERLWKGSEPTAVKIVEITLGTIMALAGTIGAEFAKAIIAGEDIAEPAFRRLASAALKDITGVDADLSLGVGQGDRRRAAARSVGAGILQALSGISAGGGTPGGQLQPGTKAAEDYLSFVVNMALEGWLTDITGELMTLGAVEQLGDLDDALSSALGLQRTSRAVMRPFIDTTVATPARWQMNKTYRPELLTASLAVKMFNRKRWTREQLNEELARQGYSDDRIEALMQDAEKKPTLAQVLRAYEIDYVPVEDVRAFLEDDGYPDRYIDFIVQFLEADKIATFQQELADAAAAAYVARRITPERFHQLLSDAGLPARDMARIRELAELKRAVNVKTLSESDAEAAFKRSLISMPDYRRILQAQGYDDDAVMIKELLLIDTIRDRDDAKREAERRAQQLADEKAERARLAEERRLELERQRAVTEPSIGMVERFVIRGRWTFDQYAQFLRSERYDEGTIAALVADVEERRIDYLADQEKRAEAERRSATRTIGLADLETAVLRGAATLDDYKARVKADKYAAADQAQLVAVLEDRIAERKELEDRRKRVNERTDDKGLAVSQLEQAVLRGIATLAQFDAFLQENKYRDFDRAVLLQLLRAKLEDQAADQARRLEQEAAAAARAVPVEQIRRAVLGGLRTFDDYRNALIDARVPASERQLLEDLLRNDVAERKAAEDTRKRIADERQVRGLSLADLERAVIFGAATVAQYQQQLADERYSAADINTLTALLLERIAEAQRLRRRRDDAALPPGPKPLTLATVASAVRVGIRSRADYFAAALQAGFSEADAQLLTELLESEIAEANAARARRTTIAADFAGDAVNLAQLAAAVRAGDATLQSYGQELSSRGYPPAEVATLVALLEREIDDAGDAAIALEGETEGDKTKQLSVTQFENAVLAGNRPIAEYVTFLDGQGFSLAAQSSLVSLLLQRLDKNAGVMT